MSDLSQCGEACNCMKCKENVSNNKVSNNKEYKPTASDIHTEARIIYDAICDSRMEQGIDMPWWSELPDGIIADYLHKAEKTLIRREANFKVLNSINWSDIVVFIASKGCQVYEN